MFIRWFEYTNNNKRQNKFYIFLVHPAIEQRFSARSQTVEGVAGCKKIKSKKAFMWRITFYWLTIFTFLYQTTIGQGKKQLGNAPPQYFIPFQLTDYNNISVQAVLNDKDTVNLMFHTAANAITLTEVAIQKLKTLSFENTTDSIQSWGGQANSSRLSKGNSLQIGLLKWEDVSIWENKNSGQYTDGKFGIDLFENKVIEIDFNRKIIIIQTTLPHRIKKYEKRTLLFENDNMFLEADFKIGKNNFKNRFLVHSGYSGDILFDDKFVNDNKIGEKLEIVGEKELKDSYGNILKTKRAILPLFKIGKEKLLNVPVGFFEGAIGRQKMSIIGGDILKRFNIIIDAQRKYVYLKSNNLKRVNYKSV